MVSQTIFGFSGIYTIALCLVWQRQQRELLYGRGEHIRARIPTANALVSMCIGSCWVLCDLSDDWSEPNLWDISGKSHSRILATISPLNFYMNGLLNRISIRQRKATSSMALVNMPWLRSSARSEVVLRGVEAFSSPCSSQKDATCASCASPGQPS